VMEAQRTTKGTWAPTTPSPTGRKRWPGRELPRMYVTEVGERWRQRTQNELTVQAKKRIFFELARGLDRYSERGQEYVDELHAIMRVNRLSPADETYLAAGPVYLVVPPK
jgi:hypothetical protein